MEFFTGVPDTDRKILFDLSGKDVINACRIGKYAQSICNEKFWYKKILIDYDVNLAKYGGFDPNIIYSDIYLSLSKILSTNLEWELLWAVASIGYLPLFNAVLELDQGEPHWPTIKYAFFIAANKGHTEIVKYITENNDLSYDNIIDASIYAASGCQIEMIKLLKKWDYDTIEAAIESNCVPIIEMLLSKPQDLRKTLYDTVKFGGNDRVLKFLIPRIDISVYGKNLLMIAVLMNDTYTAEYLLEMGADPSGIKTSNTEINILFDKYKKSANARQCKGITQKGERCKKNATKGDCHCKLHTKK